MGQPGCVNVNKVGYNNFWKYDYIYRRNLTNYFNNYNFFYKFFSLINKIGFFSYRKYIYSSKWIENKFLKSNFDTKTFYRNYYVKNKYFRTKSMFVWLKKYDNIFTSSIYILKIKDWVIFYQVIFSGLNFYKGSGKVKIKNINTFKLDFIISFKVFFGNRCGYKKYIF